MNRFQRRHPGTISQHQSGRAFEKGGAKRLVVTPLTKAQLQGLIAERLGLVKPVDEAAEVAA